MKNDAVKENVNDKKTGTNEKRDEAEKMAALGEAKALLAIANATDEPLGVLQAQLTAVDLQYDAVKRFEYVPKGDDVEVWLIGSKLRVGNLDGDKEEPTLPEDKKVFRGDDYYDGNDIGFELNGASAENADIQTPWDHVSNKESGQTSRYTSFAEAINIKGGGGAAKFSKGGNIYKIDTNVLNDLEKQGIIKILTPDIVADMMKATGSRKLIRDFQNVKNEMIRNGEILIEGSIPKKFIVKAK